ncbi:phosphatase PAP2 family protein [Actinacidiphila acidipaludis]|uniref:Phosphatase PAP2 family protein n=1 Tax=Actinacidiphila acidipaludis TaxID=2873382 RepID=A0ABS7Q1R7_9ACTN|nr:phosphatase PAP2 family protein [Streptomyces acidipaludis]MBY8877089.1 phosphatase PAP2 family protein [Streptomyces acidipaludis]
MSAFPRRWPVVTAAAWILFAALAVVLAVHGWGSFGFERAAIDWSAQHRPAAARHVAIGVTVLGTGAPPYLVALAAGAVLTLMARGPRTRKTDLALLLTPVLWLIAGQLVREGLMHAFARLRPSSVHWATTATGFSFPSGHSFSSVVCAGLLVLAIARRRPSWTRAACAVAVVYGIAVGLSRVYLGVHWPLDVLGSWLLAAGWLAAGAAVLARVDPVGRDGTGDPGRGSGAADGPGRGAGDGDDAGSGADGAAGADGTDEPQAPDGGGGPERAGGAAGPERGSAGRRGRAERTGRPGRAEGRGRLGRGGRPGPAIAS